MLKEIYPYLLVALIGAIGHILKELARLENITATFNLKVWLRKNRYKTIYGIVVTILTIIMLWSLEQLNLASAILAGYAGDSIMKTKLPALKEDPPPVTDDGETENIEKDG